MLELLGKIWPEGRTWTRQHGGGGREVGDTITTWRGEGRGEEENPFLFIHKYLHQSQC